MRDNEDRIGTKKPNSDPPMAEAVEAVAGSKANQNQSPLSFVAPTEFVSLPSKGKYYPSEHPLHGEETLELKMMTTKQEDILTSKSLLKKGVAIDRFLESLIIRNDVKTADLLVGDKNALLVAARISGYGADYVTQVTCPACAESTNFEFDLEVYTEQEGTEASEQDGVKIGDHNGALTFFITLPTTGWTIGCRPLYGRDEQAIAKLSQNKKKAGISETALTDQLTSLVVSVEGRSDKGTIGQAIANMPAKDSRFLRDLYKTLIPNIDMEQTFVCSYCAYDTEMEVPLTAEFFWPKS
jgi:hypothetical protein